MSDDVKAIYEGIANELKDAERKYEEEVVKRLNDLRSKYKELLGHR